MNWVIGVGGATGSLGKELLEVLHGVSWQPSEIRAMASPASRFPYVEYGDRQIPVDNLEDQEPGEVDALFLALPYQVAQDYGTRALRENTLTIDLSGALLGTLPLVDPRLLPNSMEAALDAGGAVIPSATALAIGRILGALRATMTIESWNAQVLLPASSWGREGTEELSNQVIALFNQGTPTRKRFPTGLAFDFLPQVGEHEGATATDLEQQTRATVQALSGVGRGDVSLVGAPVFTGIGGSLWVRGAADLEAVRRALTQGGLHLPASERARHIPHPRGVDGREDISVGRLRATNDGIYLWFSLDNLRVTAALAVEVCGVLLQGTR